MPHVSQRVSPGLENPLGYVRELKPATTPHVQQPPNLQHSQRHRIKLFLCRLDVCWTLFFFLFLLCVALITTLITQINIDDALRRGLYTTHQLHIDTLYKKASITEKRGLQAAGAFLSMHAERALEMNSEATLATLCSVLAAFAKAKDARFLSINSYEAREAVACIRTDKSASVSSQLYGWMTNNSVIPGVYLINSSTYQFERPLSSVYGGWPSSMYNLTESFEFAIELNDLFDDAEAFYNGSLEVIDYTKMWRSYDSLPHILHFTVPAGFVYRDLPLPSGFSARDYVDMRINGAGMFSSSSDSVLVNIAAVGFINSTLSDDDPSVLTNNWGQASVNDTNLLAAAQQDQVTYLKVSGITNKLMHAGLKHIDLKALHSTFYNASVAFVYAGAPAIVTAVTLTTPAGLTLPIVFVSSGSEIAMPYRRIMLICNGVNAIAIIVMTALFWLFIHRYLHQPLQRVANAMQSTLRTGRRRIAKEPRSRLFQLSEVQQLLEVHRATTKRLHQIDAFIPKEVRRQAKQQAPARASISDYSDTILSLDASPNPISTVQDLIKQFSTVVYITLQSCDVVPAPLLTTATPQQQQSQRPYAGQRLAAVVAHAARAAELVNSGPFPTPAALEAFVAALHRCCDDCDGTVLRLTPDSCVLHFGRAARTHLTTATSTTTAAAGGGAAGGDADTDACAARDARSALRFAFALLRWVDRCDAARMPDVRVLVDTGVFTCGQYRPRGSEQTMFVALGRDVQRKLGHVPAAIGVRVAMTEETARCVRAGAGADAACGVRQLPVEAFHVGRPGLNADVVILFEALPGRAEDEAWRLYARHCARAFSALVRGDYAGALRHYREVAWIADLEPGLVPHSLRREAARSSAVAGAASTQVERLMRECVQRVVRGRTQPFLRERHVPLGIDAVLGASTPAGAVPETVASPAAGPQLRRTQSGRHGSQRQRAMLPRGPAAQRHVVEMRDGGATVRAVVASPLEWVLDNYGLQWHVASQPVRYTPEDFWKSRLPCLGSAGALAVTNFLAYREVPPVVANAIRDAPLGPMSDALRSAVPVFGVTSRQKAALHTLYRKQRQLQHPNLLIPLGYSITSEGGVVLIWEHSAGGTLRELLTRYYRLKSITVARYMHHVISALAYLHRRHIVHCAVHLDNVMVGANGVCRLRGHVVDKTIVHQHLVMPRTCYVSPRMAAGETPTPECDMFCYGLMCLEIWTKSPVWQWATAAQDTASERTEEELSALMSGQKEFFYAAVVSGEVVPNLTALNAAPLQGGDEQSKEVIRSCLSSNPSQRPTSVAIQNRAIEFMAGLGFDLREMVL